MDGLGDEGEGKRKMGNIVGWLGWDGVHVGFLISACSILLWTVCNNNIFPCLSGPHAAPGQGH